LIRIAFGKTNLNKGLSLGGIDGIGVYCKHLYENILKSHPNFQLTPFQFGNFPSVNSDIKFPSYPKYLVSNYLAIYQSQFEKSFKEFDLIHATDLLIPISNKKTVATVMDTIPISHPYFTKSKFNYLKGRVWKQITKKVNHIITCSEFSKNEICKYFDFDSQYVSVIPLGVEESYFERKTSEEISHVRNKFLIPEKYFFYTCTIQPRKNIVRLIQAHQKLSSNIGKEIPLIIAGKFSWDDGIIMKTIQEAQKDGRCIWLNYISEHEKMTLLQGALGVPFVSLYEGFGLPIIEAFASKTPVIASKCSSLPEIAGQRTKLIDPFSIESIKSGLEYLINNEILLEDVSLNYERVKVYNWERTVSQTISLYSELIN